jgi:hypothetical protein
MGCNARKTNKEVHSGENYASGFTVRVCNQRLDSRRGQRSFLQPSLSPCNGLQAFRRSECRSYHSHPCSNEIRVSGIYPNLSMLSYNTEKPWTLSHKVKEYEMKGTCRRHYTHVWLQSETIQKGGEGLKFQDINESIILKIKLRNRFCLYGSLFSTGLA